jgi:polysaccharide biosynthesis protein PslF
MIPLMAKLLSRQTPFLVQFANIGEGGGLRDGLRRFLFRKLGRYRYGSLMVSPDVFVALSEDHRRRILALMPSAESRTHIIPCCPQMPMASDRSTARRAGRRRLDIADQEILVTFFGRLYPQKGIEQLIEALASLLPTRPNLRLALIGGFLDPQLFFNTTASYEEDLHACIRRHGVANFVRFSGEFSWNGPEASEYLYATDVAVLPLGRGIHLYNGSLAALCAHGAPVIGTRGTVVDSALKHRENVYFISNPEPPTIATALREVLDDQNLQCALRAGSKLLADEYFNWRKSIARLSELLDLGPATHNALGARTGSRDHL